MEKDYIVIGGVRYRVEVNWNATAAYLKMVGRDTLDELSRIGDIRPSDLMPLMAACIAEGERLDGRTEAPSPLDLGAVVTPDDVTEFIRIYIGQSAPKVEVDPPKKEEPEETPAP